MRAVLLPRRIPSARPEGNPSALDLAKGVGVPGIRQAAAEPFPETAALIESLMAAKGIAVSPAK